MKVKTKEGTKDYRTLWFEEGRIHMIDQTLLPYEFRIYVSKSLSETCEAIKNMRVRGAPAIGVTAAYGMVQGAAEYEEGSFLSHMAKCASKLKATRPTAYDLFYAVDLMLSAAGEEDVKALRKRADSYAEESSEMCRKIGLNGERLIEDGMGVLTHCNAGALGCVDYGTALAPLRMAKEKDRDFFVYVDETRPRCQGSKLTAWELAGEDIEHAIIVDNAAGYYMWKGDIGLVIVGADRVAANGDVANKIGTYEKAVLAYENKIPFYVAAPRSTFDSSCPTGKEIKIEERSQDEVLEMWGFTGPGKSGKVRVAPGDSKARNPGFDITPARYITGYITEEGVMSLFGPMRA